MKLHSPVLALLLVTGPVYAQASDLDKAQAHFAAGRKLRAEGHCDLAVEEFSRAADFEPNKVGLRLNLGDCYVELERLPEAFREYKEAERIAEATKDDRRLANARDAAAKLEAKTVRVILREDETRVANVTVQVDDVAIGTAPWHVVVAPGVEHEIRASAPDGRTWSGKAQGKAGEIVRLTIALAAAGATDRDKNANVVAPEKPAPARNEPSTAPWRTVGWAGVGLGALGIGIGSAFGLMASSDKSDAACDSAGYCESDALASARSNATVANVGFIAGGALLAAGLAVVLFAPSKTGPQVKAQATSIVMEGSF